MKKWPSLFAIVVIIAIFGISGRNNVNITLLSDPPVGTTPPIKLSNLKSEMPTVKQQAIAYGNSI
jgi:hypothetical protein